MMMYSKGDTIKFKNGSIGLVLDNGMEGKEFFQKHGYKKFTEIFYDGQMLTTHYRSDGCLKGSIWYSVLMGDIKGWRAISTKGSFL